MAGARIAVVYSKAGEDLGLTDQLSDLGHHVTELIPGDLSEHPSPSFDYDIIFLVHTPPEFDAFTYILDLEQATGVPLPAAAVSDYYSTEELMTAIRCPSILDVLVLPLTHDALDTAINRLRIARQAQLVAWFRQAFELSPEPIIAISNDKHVLFSNHSAQVALGLHLEDDSPSLSIPPILAESPLLAVANDGEEILQLHDELIIEGHSAGAQIYSVYVIAAGAWGRLLTMHNVTSQREADRLKTEFVERVSRSIRSPLTTIQGSAELIQHMGPTNESQQQFISRIIFAVQNIAALLNDLLELGRIERGAESQFEPTSFPMVLRYSLEGVQSAIAQKALSLTVNLPEETLPVLGNPRRLRQMVDALLDNAIKFSPPQGSITVSLEPQDRFLVFRVSDTGIGIPTQDQPHIFDKFFRASNAIDQFKGTGLGLSMVKGIVDRHGGRIWVDSQEGKGTTVIVMLPAYTG